MAENSLKERPPPGFEKPNWSSWFQPPTVTYADVKTPPYEFKKEDKDAQQVVRDVLKSYWNPAVGKYVKPDDGTKRKYRQKKSKQKSKRKKKSKKNKSKKKKI